MDLNLLPSQAKFQAAKIRLRQQAMLLAKVIGVGWVLMVVVTFGILLVNNRNLAVQEQGYNAASVSFAKLSPNIALNQTLRYQAKLVGQILSSRFEYAKAFETIKNLFPGDVQVNRLELTKENVFQMDIAVNSNQLMDQVENRINGVNNGTDSNFKEIKIMTINDKRNIWSLSLEVTLK